MKISSNYIKTKLSKNTSLITKLELIIGNNSHISSFESLEYLYYTLEDEEWEKTYMKKFEGLFLDIMKIILHEFRIQDIFPSPNMTNEILFSLIKKDNISPIEIIKELVDSMHLFGLTKSAIAIYPLNSFGIADLGFLNFWDKNKTIYFGIHDLIVIPQQNNINKTFRALEFVQERFKLGSYKYNKELLHHFLRSRRLDWFHKNPVLFIKVNFSSHGYYENEYYLIRYLERSVSKLFLLYTLITTLKLPILQKGFSTRVINNFETNDIHHYLVLSRNGNKLEPSCIPIHRKLSKVIEISNLNIDMPVSLDKSIESKFLKLASFIDVIYRNSLGIPKKKDKYKWDFYDRIRRSLGFFVRSYQSRYFEDSILFLSIAFEIIFCDRKKENVISTLTTNLALLFSDRQHDIQVEIAKLYDARSSVAHEGTIKKLDLNFSREIYVESLIVIENFIKKGHIRLEDQTPFISYANRFISKKLGFNPKII